MKIKELAGLSPEELSTRLLEMKESYMKLRFQHATAQLDSPAKIKDMRRGIARVKTLLSRGKAS
ncbi:MAG: 50S ribosomal protein L29 [Nitrospinae bacterium]|nr:50S ribosomal protein L29 [Nitrospinota bacterium]